MRKSTWLLLLVGVLACGAFVAAGCGSDDSSSDTGSTAALTDDTSATADDTSGDDTSSDSSDVDTDEFLSECQQAYDDAGLPDTEDGCQKTADTLEQCASEADNQTAIDICQKAADAFTEGIKQATP